MKTEQLVEKLTAAARDLGFSNPSIEVRDTVLSLYGDVSYYHGRTRRHIGYLTVVKAGYRRNLEKLNELAEAC